MKDEARKIAAGLTKARRAWLRHLEDIGADSDCRADEIESGREDTEMFIVGYMAALEEQK